jgi:TPR repeat protein
VNISATIPVPLRWDGTNFIKDDAFWMERWNEKNPRGQVRPNKLTASPPQPDAKAEAAAALKKQKTQESLLAWQFQQASNGVARSQFQLGLRYLAGDGVESNRVEAIRWLGAAAAQDYVEAKEFIRTNLVQPKP